ncbi:MAG: DUF4124 domain-containing protein [Gammaproteobacteria bacterium]|nr:MAG: DUF4124 domain-containing protein [Gammaproteobacteria bacterium]
MKVSAALIFSFICILGSPLTNAASEKVYKWTDSKGVTHYGQRPPANTDTEVIKPQTGHSDPVNYPTTAVPTQTAEKKVKSNEKPLLDPERCTQARKNLETLKTYARIKMKGDDGEYKYLTPEEQKQKLDEAAKAAKESCE